MGILMLNNFGHLMPRRRIIEYGLMALGILMFLIAAVGPISRFLQRAEAATGFVSLADFTSVLAIVVFVALLAGIAYAFVAIPSQTQLQEDLPEDVRGRVFGVLNMLVSTASFLPIIIVGGVAQVVGTTIVLYVVAIPITVSGVLSYVTRGPLKPAEAKAMAIGPAKPAGLDPVAVATATERDAGDRRATRRAEASAIAASEAAAADEAAALPPVRPRPPRPRYPPTRPRRPAPAEAVSAPDAGPAIVAAPPRGPAEDE